MKPVIRCGHCGCIHRSVEAVYACASEEFGWVSPEEAEANAEALMELRTEMFYEGAFDERALAEARRDLDEHDAWMAFCEMAGLR